MPAHVLRFFSIQLCHDINSVTDIKRDKTGAELKMKEKGLFHNQLSDGLYIGTVHLQEVNTSSQL